MTQFPELFEALAAPFAKGEVRELTKGRTVIRYLTARSVMNRLDSVLGPENWWDEYVPGEHSVLCKLSVTLPDGSMLTKQDAGGYAGMADEGDDDKSGFSDAFKRAAVKFGVGRYLYRDGVATFRRIDTAAEAREVLQLGAEKPQPLPVRPTRGDDWTPRSPAELRDWLVEQKEDPDAAVNLGPKLVVWARQQNYPALMSGWSPTQVTRAYAEACRLGKQALADHQAQGSVA